MEFPGGREGNMWQLVLLAGIKMVILVVWAGMGGCGAFLWLICEAAYMHLLNVM